MEININWSQRNSWQKIFKRQNRSILLVWSNIKYCVRIRYIYIHIYVWKWPIITQIERSNDHLCNYFIAENRQLLAMIERNLASLSNRFARPFRRQLCRDIDVDDSQGRTHRRRLCLPQRPNRIHRNLPVGRTESTASPTECLFTLPPLPL